MMSEKNGATSFAPGDARKKLVTRVASRELDRDFPGRGKCANIDCVRFKFRAVFVCQFFDKTRVGFAERRAADDRGGRQSGADSRVATSQCRSATESRPPETPTR